MIFDIEVIDTVIVLSHSTNGISLHGITSGLPINDTILNGFSRELGIFDSESFLVMIDDFNGSEICLKLDLNLNILDTISIATSAGLIDIYGIEQIDNKTIIAGRFTNDFSSFSDTLEASSYYDGFVQIVDSNKSWLYQIDGNQFQQVTDFCISEINNKTLLFTGSYADSSRFGPTLLQAAYGHYLSSLFIENLPFTYRGSVLFENSINCSEDSTDARISQALIKALPGPTYSMTDSEGNYSIQLDSGLYELKLIIDSSQLKPICDTSLIINTPQYSGVIDNNNFYVTADSICAKMSIEITSPIIRGCFTTSRLYVQCKNIGTMQSTDSYASIELPPNLSYVSSSLPYDSIVGNKYYFTINNLNIYESQIFSIEVLTSCQTLIGSSICIIGNIYPSNSCLYNDDINDLMNDDISFECINEDSVLITIENTYDNSYNQVIGVYLNNMNSNSFNYQANPGQDTSFIVNSLGHNIRVDLTSYASLQLHMDSRFFANSCTSNNSDNPINEVPLNHDDNSHFTFCPEVRGAWDPNDKAVNPSGISNNNYVVPNTPLTYLIRFQNTGTDTAFTVIILDTLDSSLNIESIRNIISDHSYELNILDSNVLQFNFNNILLPDSNINLTESQGFISFTIDHLDFVPEGTVINNSAGIIFDINDPVITNNTFITLKDTNLFCQYTNPLFSPELTDSNLTLYPIAANSDSLYWIINGTQVYDSIAYITNYYGWNFICLQTYNDCYFETICDSVFIDDTGYIEQLETDFVLFPNPLNNYLHIHLNNSQKVERISIQDEIGKEIQQLEDIYSNNLTINFDESPGLYFVTIIFKDGYSQTKRITKVQ